MSECPTCGPHATEPHPHRPGVTRCANCKEWLTRVMPTVPHPTTPTKAKEAHDA